MVHAAETSLQELLEGTKQYLVPLYQRTYSWTRSQHALLWEDVVKLADDRAAGDKDATHFIGSLVLAPSPNMNPGAVQFLVVDGQQRLTTLSLLLCAIRDHRADTEDPQHRDRVNEQYLINKWKQGNLRSKLLPTQADRPSYQACLESTPHAGSGDPIGNAYSFFRSQLELVDDPDDPHDIERLEEAVISGLSLVSVTAQPGDNVHRIFESLNNTGLKLTQGDLLRNYLFMRLPTRGESVYTDLWLPLQSSLTSDDLETLFWLDLVPLDPRVKRTDTYARHQARLDKLKTEVEIVNEVTRFARLGKLFALILKPESEPNAEVRRGLERLAVWDTTTVYPLVLHLLDQRATGTTDDETVARTLSIIESFLVRRLLIGRATTGINRVLLGAVSELRPNQPLDQAVRDYLSTGRKHYANDQELRAGIESQPFYFNGKPHQRTLVLRWLEESFKPKEPVDLTGLTIEHVMPQTLTPLWRRALAADLPAEQSVDEVHDQLLHTLGNLTLTGYNPELSNKDFAFKRNLLQDSGVQMNKEIAKNDHWARQQVITRASLLADRAVAIWTGPSNTAPSGNSELWQLMNQALAALPAGSWTTYGDLAVLIGTHAVPVGMRLSAHPAPNAHRVLQAAGTVSPGFQWLEADRTDDPMDVLRQEGVTFDAAGHATPAQRITSEELAELVGLTTEGLEPVPDPSPGDNAELRDRFVEQLSAQNNVAVVNAVLKLLNRWSALGGTFVYGTNKQTSCFMMARPSHPTESIWPVTIYPVGRVEVVFQWMATRAPFDNLDLRNELRERFNAADGIELPASKIQMRPSFPLDVLADAVANQQVTETLEWFYQRSQ